MIVDDFSSTHIGILCLETITKHTDLMLSIRGTHFGAEHKLKKIKKLIIPLIEKHQNSSKDTNVNLNIELSKAKQNKPNNNIEQLHISENLIKYSVGSGNLEKVKNLNSTQDKSLIANKILSSLIDTEELILFKEVQGLEDILNKSKYIDKIKLSYSIKDCLMEDCYAKELESTLISDDFLWYNNEKLIMPIDMNKGVIQFYKILDNANEEQKKRMQTLEVKYLAYLKKKEEIVNEL